MPSAQCLVSLIEKPFFVLFLKDIEFVSIERIDNKIKNFDLAIIFKDYHKPVKTIDNISKDKLQQIKEWLDSQNILFFEGGNISLNWNKYLKRVCEDPQGFIDNEGGWKAFVDESDSEQYSVEENDDEFDVEEFKEIEDEDQEISMEEMDEDFDEEEEEDWEKDEYFENED